MSPGETIALYDDEAKSEVTIVPARGAIVTRFRVGDRDVLYLDEATLRDPQKNVRGGVPILFPSPGKLEGDHFERGGKSGSMKQHGFARNLPWAVGGTREEGAAAATLTLASNEQTRAAYPWDFSASIDFSLRGRCLRLAARVQNEGDSAMPFGFGIHPYFAVHDKAAARIATRATRAFDNVAKKVVPFGGFDLTLPEVDMHLLDHGGSSSELTWGDGARLALRASHDLTRWVVWTLAGRDFVCLEPWTCPGNALNTGEGLIELAPGASRELWIELDFSP